jgi:hypothetical protein
MAEAADIERLKAMGLSDQAIAEILGFDLVKYQTEAQRRAAEVASKNAAALAAAQKTGISNMDYYVNPIGGDEIIPGMSADIMAGLGMYNPQYQAVMRTYGSQTDRDNENDVTERSTFAVDPNGSYRLVDGKGNVIGSTSSGDSIRSLVDAANQMSASQGKVANWTIEKAGYGDSWQSVATDRPDYGTFDKIAGAALPIVVSMIPGLQGVGAVLAQAAAGGAGSAISGGDPLKGAVVGGLTAAGSELLGPYIESVNAKQQVATKLGSAVGAGAGSFAGNIATGQNFQNSLLNAGIAGLSDYLASELSEEVTDAQQRAASEARSKIQDEFYKKLDFYRDISDLSGITSELNQIVVNATKQYGDDVGRWASQLATNVISDLIKERGGESTDGAGGSTDGGIDVTGTSTGGTTAGIGNTGAINVTGTRTGDNTQDTTGGTPTTVVTAQNAGDTKVDDKGTPTTVVTAQGDGKTGDNKTDDKGTPTTVVTAQNTGDNKTDDTKKDEDDGEIVVDAPITPSPTPSKTGTNTATSSGITVSPTPTQSGTGTGSSTPSGSPTVSPSGSGTGTPTPSGTKKWTWKDWARLGLLAPTLIKGLGDLLDSGDGSEVITPDQSKVSFTPMNRERGIGTFDPFTYGQAGPGKQTAEFEFFKPAQTAPVTQTYTPATVQTVGGTPRYQYTQQQVDALNAATMNTYNQNLARFNAYQDDLAKQVEAGTLTLDQAIKQANTFGAGLGAVAPVTAAEGGYMAYAEGGEMNDDMVKHLMEYRKGGGHHGPGPVNGIGSGQEDKIPAWLSDGEYVWSAQDVADLGDGSTNEGVRRLDKMRQMVRKRAGRKNVKKIAKPQQGIEQMLKAVGSKA